MNNNMSLIVVSVSKVIIECDNDTPADGSSLSGTNDADITKQNTEIAIDETVSIAMTSVSVITMNRFFIFTLCSFQLSSFLIRFLNFYLLQIITKNYL
ncbi:MAG TPA: hypothetical protein VFJ05_03850 [Nitrososphaeraceae archaeon]|nr:hypothetical protein [Nitrososphaeraceae archaeon]